MSSGIDTYLLLRAFAQELGRCGMRAACTSPGSRSAPLVLSLAREPALECYSHIDERCSAFYALGLAKASGLPVAVACTSGTAAAELLPAAIEAQQARVPLLLLSADRPAELRENGAGQAIDQLKLMGAAAKWFFEVDVEGSGEAQLRWMRTLACRAYWTALEGRAGVVHLNFPLREPLVIDAALPGDATARADGAPYVRRPPLLAQDAGAHERLRELLAGARRGVIVAGRHERPPALGAPAAALATAAGWPLLADPLSGARRGDAAVAHYDAILRDSERAAQLAPDLVLRVGDLPVSKPLRAWLAGLSGVAQVALDAEGAWQRNGPRRSAGTTTGPRGRTPGPGRHTPGPEGRTPRRRGRASGWRCGAAPISAPRRRSRGCWAPTGSPSPRSRRSWGCCWASGRRCSWPPRCRCATSRRSGRCARPPRACCATAAPTASTAPSPRPSAQRRRAAGRWCC
jgi:2-succinyl-5-enolpyruvyl-6-hydroxy-3-cyclohexene-1-carboxylate synthase